MKASHVRPLREGEEGYDSDRDDVEQAWTTIPITGADMLISDEYSTREKIISHKPLRKLADKEEVRSHAVWAKETDSLNKLKQSSNDTKDTVDAQIIEFVESISSETVKDTISLLKKITIGPITSRQMWIKLNQTCEDLNF